MSIVNAFFLEYNLPISRGRLRRAPSRGRNRSLGLSSSRFSAPFRQPIKKAPGWRGRASPSADRANAANLRQALQKGGFEAVCQAFAGSFGDASHASKESPPPWPGRPALREARMASGQARLSESGEQGINHLQIVRRFASVSDDRVQPPLAQGSATESRALAKAFLPKSRFS